MKSDFDRKKDSIRRLGEKIISRSHDIDVYFDETRDVVDMMFHREALCSVAFSDLETLKKLFVAEEVEVIPEDERISIYITGVRRWPWEM